MAARTSLLLLALYLQFFVALCCPPGFEKVNKECEDTDECAEHDDLCGDDAICLNTDGSFNCQCKDGFISSEGTPIFEPDTSAKCQDINECADKNDICGPGAKCSNTAPYYFCTCEAGFMSSTGVESFQQGDNVTCEDKCMIDKTICGNGTCRQGHSSHSCECHKGFTNYGKEWARCTALNCDVFKDHLEELHSICLKLINGETPTDLDAMSMLQMLLSVIDKLLSSGSLNNNRKVSTFLDIVENALRLIGPFMKTPSSRMSSNHTELDLRLQSGVTLPKGDATLSSKQAQLDIKMETAAGDPSIYPGFTVVSLLSYTNLQDSAEGFYSGMKPEKDQTFKINSKVVTVTVSNRDTSHLKESVILTLNHLRQDNQTSHICVFWNASEDGGSWSTDGCSVLESSSNYTVCSCNHLSSFAVLMALYEIEEDKFALQLISWVGLSLSLICLFLCILTFSLIRSIQSPRTTIHLHLCISLFIAILIFLAGISRTENQVGCAVVAGLLHFFFLAAFCWMCLEGVQLFRMVVLVFNTSFKTLYMMAAGYGVPAVIVAISASVNAKGYGTKKHCWLNLEFIWSFMGPACVIIIINIFFFLITVWKLAQKFSSLNPDLDTLHKIKAFTITAVAQLCLLGIMWIFGCFQFEEGTVVMSYLFTIFGSLQGVMLFVMHCLFSKQVREEYANILSRCCAPQKKNYLDISHSNTAKAHASKSSQDTGESHI
ncbi:adhesion G protein-coupled receptor E5 [Aulostomus maculatus]